MAQPCPQAIPMFLLKIELSDLANNHLHELSSYLCSLYSSYFSLGIPYPPNMLWFSIPCSLLTSFLPQVPILVLDLFH